MRRRSDRRGQAGSGSSARRGRVRNRGFDVQDNMRRRETSTAAACSIVMQRCRSSVSDTGGVAAVAAAAAETDAQAVDGLSRHGRRRQMRLGGRCAATADRFQAAALAGAAAAHLGTEGRKRKVGLRKGWLLLLLLLLVLLLLVLLQSRCSARLQRPPCRRRCDDRVRCAPRVAGVRDLCSGIYERRAWLGLLLLLLPAILLVLLWLVSNALRRARHNGGQIGAANEQASLVDRSGAATVSAARTAAVAAAAGASVTTTASASTGKRPQRRQRRRFPPPLLHARLSLRCFERTSDTAWRGTVCRCCPLLMSSPLPSVRPSFLLPRWLPQRLRRFVEAEEIC